MSELVIAEKADLVAIADVIRTLADKTEDMSLGEMAAEVSNANVNKTDILSALTEKGVDTTGAGLADIAALVAGIQAGGGDFWDVTGTYTPATDELASDALQNLTNGNHKGDDWCFVNMLWESGVSNVKGTLNAYASFKNGNSFMAIGYYDSSQKGDTYDYFTYANNKLKTLYFRAGGTYQYCYKAF